MDYAVYRHRSNSNCVIFDRDLANPPVGTADDYDCIGVFRAPPNSQFVRVDGRFVLQVPGGSSEDANTIWVSKADPLWIKPNA